MNKRKGRSRYRDLMRLASLLWGSLPILILLLTAPSVGNAQVPPPITSSGLNTQISDPITVDVQTQYDITGGTRPGGASGTNLFHSFGDFSVDQGDIANFLNGVSFDLNGNPLAADLPTSNIIGRVTGGNISNIYGTIQTTDFDVVDGVPTNLYLANPNGFVFGPQGSLNVTGSVSFSTAQYLRLFDSLNGGSANFYADSANDGRVDSVLFLPPLVDFGFLSPAAYGFLTAPDPSATITVQGSALSVPSGQSISLVGGKVVIEGATLPDQTVQRAQLTAPNGSILLATSASPGEFDATGLFALPNVGNAMFTSYGFALLPAGSSINVSGAHTVWIKGGQLVLSVNDATLNTSGTTAPQDTISLGPGSFIWTSNSETDASAPDLQLTASDVQLTGTSINSQADGPGRGGHVDVAADRGVTLDQVSILAQTAGLGAGGNVSIHGVQGAGSPAESVTLSGFSQVGTATSGDGTGGEISITAKFLDLDLDPAKNGGSTLQSSTFGSAPNGDIVVSAQQTRLSKGAVFQSVTAFSGENPPVGGKITVQGLQGSGRQPNSLILDGPGTGLKTVALGGGRLGDIDVHATTLSMEDGAVILAGSSFDAATAGSVTIDADSVGLSGGSIISSHAFNLDAGPVRITADQFSLDNSTIETDTSSPTGGRGGDVILNVPSVSLKNGATINSSASNTGFAGNINILASGSVTMTNGSTIVASSTGTGNAGDISINSMEVPGNTFEMQNSTINTSAALADGGNIGIYATNMVRLTDSSIKSSVGNETKTDTFGGNITIDPQFVVLQNSQIFAQAFAGAGGNITIVANVFLADPSSLVDASSQLGVSGTINIQSPLQNIGGELAALSEEFSSAAALLAQQCAARAADGKFSTFVVAAREGLPVEPGGFLASPSLTPELLGSSLSLRDPLSQFSAATGLFSKYEAQPIQLAKLGNACHR